MIAGKMINMSGNRKIENDGGFLLQPELNPWHNLEEAAKKEKEAAENEGGDDEGGDDEGGDTGVLYYTPQHYVECTGTAAWPPNANC